MLRQVKIMCDLTDIAMTLAAYRNGPKKVKFENYLASAEIPHPKKTKSIDLTIPSSYTISSWPFPGFYGRCEINVAL